MYSCLQGMVFVLIIIVFGLCVNEGILLGYSDKCGSFEGDPYCPDPHTCWGDLTRILNYDCFSIESRTDLEWAALVEASHSTAEQVRSYASRKVSNWPVGSFYPSPERISKGDHIATAYNYYAYEICYDVKHQLTHLPKLLCYVFILALLGHLGHEVKKAGIRASFASKSFKRARDEARCFSCNENIRDVLLQDCNHLCLCAHCVTFIDPFQCPICHIGITTEPLTVNL